MNYGLWYDFRNPEPWRVPFEQFYAQCLDQIAAAEQLGFNSTWLTEHHFCDDGYTPSPLVIAAAIGEQAFSRTISDKDIAWGPCPAFFPAGCELAAIQGCEVASGKMF